LKVITKKFDNTYVDLGKALAETISLKIENGKANEDAERLAELLEYTEGVLSDWAGGNNKEVLSALKAHEERIGK